MTSAGVPAAAVCAGSVGVGAGVHAARSTANPNASETKRIEPPFCWSGPLVRYEVSACSRLIHCHVTRAAPRAELNSEPLPWPSIAGGRLERVDDNGGRHPIQARRAV